MWTLFVNCIFENDFTYFDLLEIQVNKIKCFLYSSLE